MRICLIVHKTIHSTEYRTVLLSYILGESFGKLPSLPMTIVLFLKRDTLYFRVTHVLNTTLKYIQEVAREIPLFYQAEKRLRTLYGINGQQYQLLLFSQPGDPFL